MTAPDPAAGLGTLAERLGCRVVGVGVDLCDIRRIGRSVERFGDRFLARVYTPEECAACERRPGVRLNAYAKRWAAKEACAKALGTGFAKGVAQRDIEVETLPSGAPVLRLYGGAAARLSALTPPETEARLHLSLTDEPPYAQAFVIIEAAATHKP
ncbi:MAG: holo-ACP synthase [Pseudomonadota bacterium]